MPLTVSSFKIDRARIQEIASKAGRFIFVKPLVVFAVCMGVSFGFLLFMWWQYAIRLDFARETEREGILLHEEELKSAVESIEHRKERFDNALKQEYRDLFQ